MLLLKIFGALISINFHLLSSNCFYLILLKKYHHINKLIYKTDSHILKISLWLPKRETCQEGQIRSL